MSEKHSTLFVRIAFTLVFILNVQCALQFVFIPQGFAPSYELSGVSGIAATQGMGVAFLMWNATYPAFIIAPKRFKVLGPVILVQQAIGLFGETAILMGIPAGHELLAGSIMRFIAFDGAGLVIMAIAFTFFCMATKKATTDAIATDPSIEPWS